MAARHYGLSPKTETVDSGYEDLTYEEPVKKSEAGPFFAAMMLGFVLIGGILFLFLYQYLDMPGGAFSPEDAAVSWVGAVTDQDPSAVLEYCIPMVRRKGFLADSFDITDIRRLMAENHISFPGRSIKDMSSVKELDALEAGYFEIYGKDVKIQDARRAVVSTDMEWLDDEGVARRSRVDLTIVCVRVGMKWYVYTGRPLRDSDRMEISLPAIEPKQETVAVDTPVIFAPEPEPESFVRESRPLLKKDGLRESLEEGYVEMEGLEQKMPCLYANLNHLIAFQSEDQDWMLAPGAVLENLPVGYVNEVYEGAGLSIAVGNAGDETVPVSEGSVVSLFVSVSELAHQGYPEIYLPGNVTFGTLYIDVADLYGNLEAVTDDAFEVPEGTAVYSVILSGNRHNKLYLYFRSGKLWGMRWDCYDFNYYSGDIA